MSTNIDNITATEVVLLVIAVIGTVKIIEMAYEDFQTKKGRESLRNADKVIFRGEQYTPKQFEKQAASPGEMSLEGGKKISKALRGAIKDFVNSVGKEKLKEVTLSSSKGKGQAASYQTKALQARDAALTDVATWSYKKKQDVTTIAAGYDRRTGKVAVGINLTSVNHGLICAEDLVVAQLGDIENINNIVMTPAIRPRNGQIVPVCKRCQTKYPRSSFMPGTPFL